MLHNSGDSDDLATKIVAMLTDSVRAAEFGRQASARCEQNFYPITVAAQTIDYYRRVVWAAATNGPGK